MWFRNELSSSAEVSLVIVINITNKNNNIYRHVKSEKYDLCFTVHLDIFTSFICPTEYTIRLL